MYVYIRCIHTQTHAHTRTGHFSASLAAMISRRETTRSCKWHTNLTKKSTPKLSSSCSKWRYVCMCVCVCHYWDHLLAICTYIIHAYKAYEEIYAKTVELMLQMEVCMHVCMYCVDTSRIIRCYTYLYYTYIRVTHTYIHIHNCIIHACIHTYLQVW